MSYQINNRNTDGDESKEIDILSHHCPWWDWFYINGDAMALLDNNSKFIYFNEATCQLFAVSKEILVKSYLIDLSPSKNDFIKQWEKRSNQVSSSVEITLIRGDGISLIISLNITPNFGETAHYLCVFRDITYSKQIEAELTRLKNTEKSSTNLLNLSSKVGDKNDEIISSGKEILPPLIGENLRDYGLYLLDINGNIILGNQGAEKIYGWSESEVIHQNFSMFFTLEDQQKSQPETVLKNVILQRKYEEKGWRVRRDGSVFLAEIILTPFCDQLGEICGFINLTQDITEEKTLENLVENYDTDLSQSSRLIPVAIFITDPQGFLTYVNKNWCELTQLSLEESLGEGWMKALHPRDLPWVKITWKQTIETEKDWDYQYRFLQADGRVIWVNGEATPLRDIHHNLRGFIGTIRKTTEDKKREDTLQFLVETMVMASGEKFWAFVVQQLASFFQVRWAFISEIVDLEKGKVRLLTLWNQDQHETGLEYSIYGTPCAEVIGKNIAIFSEKVQDLFPQDQWLEKMGIESYLGIPLFSTTGVPLGHFGIMDNRPFAFQSSTEFMLRILATRMGSELERKRAEDELIHREFQFREAQRLAHLGSWEFDRINLKITGSEEAFLLLGLKTVSLTYKDCLKSLTPNHRLKFRKLIKKMLKEPGIYQEEFCIEHPEKGISYLDWRGETRQNSHGKIIKLQGTLLEITNRKYIENSFRESQLKYQTLFDIFPIGISVTDPLGNLLEANPASEEILGVSIGEHISRTYDDENWSIIRSDGSKMSANEFASVRALRENRLVKNVEMGIIKTINNQEEITWINVTAAPIPLENYGVVITYIDITHQKTVEKTLYQREQEFRALVENTPDLIQRLNSDLIYLYINPIIEKLTGLPPQYWLGKTSEEISLIPQGLMNFKPLIKNIFLQGKERTIETTFLTLQGLRYYQSRLLPEFSKNGEVESVLIISHDITERKSTEDAIVQHLEFMNTLVETVGEGIIVTDPHSNFILYNRGMEEITGYSAQESQYPNFLQSLYPNPLSYQGFIEEMLQAFQGKKINNSEWEITRKDGEKRNIIVSSRILNYGKSHLLLSAIRDITDRKLAESRLAKINDCFLEFGSDPHENIDRLTQLCGELLGANYVIYTHQENEKLYVRSHWYKTPQNSLPSPLENLCLDLSKNIYNQEKLAVKNFDKSPHEWAELMTEYGWTIRCQNVGVGVLCTGYQNKTHQGEDESHVIGIIATAIRVEEERRQTQENLQLQMKQENLLRSISQRIRQTLNLNAILNTTVSEVRNFLQCDRVLVLRIYPNRVSHVITESVSADYNSILGQVFKEECFPETSYQIYQQGIIRVIHNVTDYYESDCLQKLVRSLQVQSKLVIPLLQEAKMVTDSHFSQPDYLWGLLVAHQCSSPRHWEKWEEELLNSLATQVAIAIHQSQLYEKLKKANQNLKRLADLDGLTKLANRRRFDEYLVRMWRELQRSQEPLSLILCDVDYFKLYNDTYGHQAGDECLKSIARMMGEIVQHPDDLSARYGGEEFAVILPHTDSQGAIVVAEKIREKVSQLKIEHQTSLVSKYVSLSLGIATLIPSLNSTPDQLIQAADFCLYQAKEQGRNCYFYQRL